MIIVPAEQKVGAKIEVLWPAMACDIRRVGHPQSFPQLVALMPGAIWFRNQLVHRKLLADLMGGSD
jgi:hypothetical protein